MLASLLKCSRCSVQTEDQVRTALFDLLTKEDDVLDNTLTPNQQNQAIKPLFDTRVVSRKRNSALSPVPG